MKISLKWLNDYVDIAEFLTEPARLARALIDAGLEVEAIENQAENFKNVVTGHIIELGRHPNADKLTLCQVDTGEGRPRQIVCGAKNHKQGDKVVVALPGAVLPGNFAIQLSKIRDVESQGMLCSETELGLKTESEGIVILPKETKVGQAFAQFSGRDDVFFEVNVTPNRADCLSHLGLAREISCLLDRKLKVPTTELKAGTKKNLIDVKLHDRDLCTRYTGRSIFGIKVAASPDWLRDRLTSVGVNSINNIVDVTNFVMLEFGQPLHAFDADALKGHYLSIEKAKAKEKFKSFDGTEFELKGDELTIRDKERAVALAGVVGGLNSGVTDATTNIFLEVAHFSPKGVRRTSRKLGVETDSSLRFSRGTDPEALLTVVDRAMGLIQQLAGGEVSKDYVDLNPAPIERQAIKVKVAHVGERLGYPVESAEFVAWMKRLHCKTKVTHEKASPSKGTVAKESGDVVTVEAPSYRVDIENEIDLIEEFARLNGYDKIPESFPQVVSRPLDHAATYVHEERIANLISQEGYFEARNYNFVNPKWQNEIYETEKFNKLGLSAGGVAVPILNPLSEDTSVMRQTLLCGLLTNVLHNYNRGETAGRLFETGFVFGKATQEAGASYIEPHRFALVCWGAKADLWSKGQAPAVFEIKSTIQTLARRLRGKLDFRAMTANEVPAIAHPGQVASLFYEGKTIGFIGALHPALRDEFKIRTDVAIGEVDLTALMRGQPRVPKTQPISKFQSVERDFALVMPTSLAVGEVVREIEKSGAPLLQSVHVFDVFKGGNFTEGQQSVAFRVILQDQAATLSDAQVQAATQKILAALEKKFSIKPR